ncbi:MAG TPA: RidA family protein [Candidatus Hydrogenedentes bacterium]|nr:RidA family protein [Candidatus Hydrogenedentota bacterium]
MSKRCVTAPKAPAAVGPYSHATIAGNLVFLSGQGPMAPDGSGPRRDSFEVEVRQTLDNIKAVLEGAGTDLEHVVKMNVYLADMNDFAEMNGIYKEYFPSNPPARTTIQAGRLPLDFRIEIEAIAVLPQ